MEIDFDTLYLDMKEAKGIDLYSISYPKIQIDDELGQRLMAHFNRFLLMMNGLPPETATKFIEDDHGSWSENNKGRSFSFWHYLLDVMDMVTHDTEHRGSVTIHRGMSINRQMAHVDDDLVRMFAFPYVAKGDVYAKPVLDAIFDHYGVDEILIHATVSR